MKISHEQWLREAALLQLRLLRVIAKGINNEHMEFQHPDGDGAEKSFNWLADMHEELT